jgi:hypothetical protein
MRLRNLPVSVNPKAMSYGNTEATWPSQRVRRDLYGRPRPMAGEDTVRTSVKAEEAGRNDQPRGSVWALSNTLANSVTSGTFTIVWNGSGIFAITA